MKINYLPAAQAEYKRKLESIALRPFTTHSVRNFIEDIEYLEREILRRPGARRIPEAPLGYFRVGPSPVYSYSLTYRIRDGNIYIVAVAAPGRRPLYWLRRQA